MNPPKNEPLGRLLERKAGENTDKTYLYFQNREISYAEIDRRSNQMANALAGMGVTRGDHVALMLPNRPEYLYCWFGLAKLGAVTVTLNTQAKGDTLKYLITASDSKLLIVDSALRPECGQILDQARDADKLFFDFPEDASEDTNDAKGALGEILNRSAETPPPNSPLVEDTDPLIITFTSGTTGMPKLVRNCHRAYITAALDLAEYTEIVAEDRIYSSLPLYHANPQTYCILTALVANASVIVAPRFSATRFWKDIRRYRATAFSYVGAVLPILLAQPEQANDRDVPARKCFGGGAPKEVYDGISRRFGVEVLELYGMSETGAWNTINRPGKGRSGAIGQVRKGFDLRIFNEKDEEVPTGKIGEIVIRPEKPYIMFDGYYKLAEETIKCSSNWWFHTGDLARVDEDGFYYFCGRKKEAIRRGGENISPYEIEKVITAHPAVAECAAYGIIDPVMEEEIKVGIVLKPSQRVSPGEIIALCEAGLPRFMVPRYIEFMDALPKTASEKVRKVFLKELGVTPDTWDRKKEGT